MISRDGESIRRLFFALWPDETVRDRLQRISVALHADFSARWVQRENYHITVAFLGAVPEAKLPGLLGMKLAGHEEFVLRLQTLRVLGRKQMIWIVPAETPAALQRLVSDAAERLRGLAQACDGRPFHPHLTLARLAKGGPMKSVLCDPVVWTIRSLALLESRSDRSGVHYEVLQSWPFKALPEGGSVE